MVKLSTSFPYDIGDLFIIAPPYVTTERTHLNEPAYNSTDNTFPIGVDGYLGIKQSVRLVAVIVFGLGYRRATEGLAAATEVNLVVVDSSSLDQNGLEEQRTISRQRQLQKQRQH